MKTAQTLPTSYVSVEDYLRLEESSLVRHEYVGGVLHALAGESERHGVIVQNIASRLWIAARGMACRVVSADLRVRIGLDVFYYPDIVVDCDPTDDEPMIKYRPCVVVEVLSPTTRAIDRREELLNYRRIESLQAYVLVHQDERRVEVHARDERGGWQLNTAVEYGAVSFPCVNVELTLDEIYEDLPAE